ncbi:MAG TPA: hypothetical protein VGR96_11235 [Acidobacteriaceae bacterium]|nr:hypothetical protein [Acidobacteriaceae bacterium]
MTFRNPFRFIFFLLALLATVGAAASSWAEDIAIPPGTPLAVQLDKHLPMKLGETFEVRLIYPVYAKNQLVIPAGSRLRGRVVRLESDKTRRLHARLMGDFTPFHVPVVQFDQVALPDGTSEPLVSGDTSEGAPILRLSTPASKRKGSFVSQQISQAKQRVKDQVAVFTAPGRRDRLVQFLYTQLPYHPERIESGTSWTLELAQPLHIPVDIPPQTQAQAKPPEPKAPAPAALPAPHKAALTRRPPPAAAPVAEAPAVRPAAAANPSSDPAEVWHLHAYLEQTISSANAKAGDTFQAIVAEPTYGAQHKLEVPEGAMLIGTVTQAKAARSFGRKGKLRFSFRELKLPDGFTQDVQGSLSAADSNKSSNLQIDSEGGIQPKSQNGIIMPMLLTALASRALDTDGSQAGNGAVASNGMGLVGRVVGIVAGSPNIAAGIGFYGAGLSFYYHWIAHGQNVVFVKDTRIEVSTMATHGRMSVHNP